MTEIQHHRKGLGFPPAVIIKSSPLPSKPQRLLTEDAQAYLDSPSRYQDYVTWKEWNINPAKHGPERMRQPPVFLPSQQSYDELGRSMRDGVEVNVAEGRTRREIEDGGRVAEWYLALSRRDIPDSGPSILPSPPTVEIPTKGARLQSRSSHHTAKPERAYRHDWFTRRSQPLSTDEIRYQNTMTEPSSISSLLNVAPAQNRAPTAHYVLGPENKGYTLLRDR